MLPLLSFDIPNFLSGSVLLSLFTLTFLEIVLGVDNIIFISIATSKLKDKEQKKATNIGLIFAMFFRILLLLGISYLIAMSAPWFNYESEYLRFGFSGQSLILIAGGIFLLYKSVTEIHHKLDIDNADAGNSSTKKVSLNAVIIQITVINIVFSFDSILTAVGMTNGMVGALIIMIIAVVLSVILMMLFAVEVGRFVNKNPTIQMLGLAFLILIGFMLIIEGAHLANLSFFGNEVGSVPKGYLYFAIAFSLLVEFLNIKLRKKSTPIELNSATNQAEKQGIL